MAGLSLTIGGVDRTSMFRAGTFSGADDLNARATCSFELLDPSGAYRPTVGATVIVLNPDGSTREFSGTIDSYDEWQVGATDLHYAIRCVDLNQIPDRHLVARAYSATTAGAIVADIIANDLAGETAIVSTDIDAGATIAKIVFNYAKATDAFNELAQYSGFTWWLDYSGVFHFKDRGSVVAPFSILDTDTPCKARKGIRVVRTRDQYRNRQYLRAGTDLTAVRVESFKGDGTLKTFVLNFPAGIAPTVTVTGVAKTVGIRGVDADSAFDWFWNKGAAEITQQSAAVAITSADTLAVTYQGQYPIIAQVQNDAEISARMSVEGGSGVYEAKEDDASINSQTAAQDKATAIIRRFGAIPVSVEFETDLTGLHAGQLIPILLTAHGLSGSYLIDSVRARDVDGMWTRYTVHCLDGSSLGGWQDFFRRLVNSGADYVIRDNEVLLIVRNLADAVACGDSLAQSSTAPEKRVGFALVGYAEVG